MGKQMARFCPLFSGSSGNCTYIGSASGGVLVDTGVSARRIECALNEREIDPRSIQAVFITHEHTDHVSGLRVLAKPLQFLVASHFSYSFFENQFNLQKQPRSPACP